MKQNYYKISTEDYHSIKNFLVGHISILEGLEKTKMLSHEGRLKSKHLLKDVKDFYSNKFLKYKEISCEKPKRT